MTELELCTERLRIVEKQLRWIKRGMVVLGIVITAGSAVAQLPPLQVRPPLPEIRDRIQDPPVEQEIRSRRFALVDARGKERASLVTDQSGSVFLVMFDAADKMRASVSVNNDGPSLAFYDRSGQSRVIVGSTSVVASHVNENGLAERAPASSIVLFDRTGKLLWREP